MAVTAAQLQQLYLAYFGRPADFDGIVYYTTGNWDIWQVAQAFGESPESQALYGPGFNASVINAIYNNLFNRDAEPDGLLYWSQQVASGALTPGEAALGILLGAQNADATTVANKLTVAAAFTAELDTAQEILAYTGNAAAAAARAFLATVTADPATVTAATDNLDTVVAEIIDVGGTMGLTVALTVDPDTFNAPNQTYIDTVNGIINDDGVDNKNTFSDSDTINGNGHTVVNVTVKDATGGTPFVTLNDIGKLNLVYAGTAASTATFDASSWTNVAQITLSGADGLNADIDDLTTNTLKVKIDGATTGTIDVNTAALGDLMLTGSIQNNSSNSIGAVANFGAGIDVTVGKDGYAYFTVSQTASGGATGVAAKVGDITFTHVNLEASDNGEIDNVSIYNYASATAAAATVGSINLGDVSVVAGTDATATLSAYNYAYVNSGKGAATAGNITLGTLNINAGSGGWAYVTLTNSASAQSGNATVGNITVGDISISGTGYAYLTITNTADVNTKGTATAGNITLGNIVMMGTSATNSHSMWVFNSADSDNGKATVGNITAGNITMIGGNTGGYSQTIYLSQSVDATSGAATAGNISIGNVLMQATQTGTNYLTLENTADTYGAKAGAATVGNITVGTVDMDVASSSNYMYIYNYAAVNAGTNVATVGNITVGNVTMDQVAATGGSTNYLYISNSAYAANNGSAVAGAVQVGDISINVAGITQADANNTAYIYNYANAGATGAATLGGITVGNVTAKTGLSGHVNISISQWGSGGTDGSTGAVSVGNVAMQGSKTASMEFYVNNYMQNTGSSLGGITVGNVSIAGNTVAGTARLSVSEWAQNGSVGSVSVGSVALTANNVGLQIGNWGSGGDAGTMTVGNVSLKGGDTTNWMTNYISNYGTGNVGALSVGNVSLTSISGRNLHLDISNSSTGGNVGAVSVGNIALALTEKDANAGAGGQAWLGVYTNSGKTTGGNIVAGNITVGASGVTTAAKMNAAMQAHVSISSEVGSVTVGNITVTSGGVKGAVLAANTDNLGTLTGWLNLDAGTTVTVGAVDYSAYSGATTIDVSGFAGAASIKGGKSTNAITDNKGTNAIDLSANTTKADVLSFLGAQTAVKDSGGAITASEASLDTVLGWATGDSLTILTTAIDGDGDVIQNTPTQTYAQFLVNAEAQITVADNSAYVAVIDGNTYVALNVAGAVGQIVKIYGSHTFTWDDTNDALVYLT